MPINKSVIPSIELIRKITGEISYTVTVNKLNDHHFQNCLFHTKKGDRQFEFNSKTPIRKGLQSYTDLQVGRDILVKLDSESSQTIYTHGQYILVEHISYDGDEDMKLFSGGISRYSSVAGITDMNNRNYRYIVPLTGNAAFKISDFERYRFLEVEKSKYKHNDFIKLNVEGEIHVYNYTLDMEHYLIIDSLEISTVAEFQKKCFSILLALGFIKGNFLNDECFILSFQNNKMKNPENFLYTSMRASINTQQPLFVTSYYSVYNDIDYVREENGEISKDDPLFSRFKGDVQLFPDEAFSNLSSLCYSSEKIQRALLIFIDAHVATLEVKIPNYYVAIEAIAGYIEGVRKKQGSKISAAPIKNPDMARELISEIKEIISHKKETSKMDDEEFAIEILFKNIDRLNSPPNADKLKEAFIYVDYILTLEQKKLLIDRNLYLHGSFLKTVDDEELFKKGLFAALKLESMIAVLIFRLCKYSGPMINYTALYSSISDLGHDEDRVWDI